MYHVELTLKGYPKYVQREKNSKNKIIIIYIMLNISMEKYYHYFFDDRKQ